MTRDAGNASAPVSRGRARSPFRVPILAIVLVVAACAIAITAVRTASKEWHATTYTFTVFLLLLSVLLARFRRGIERAFWFGFGVFGWGFFLLGYRPWMDAFREGNDDSGGLPFNPLLLTSRLIVYLLPRLRKGADEPSRIDDITAATLGILHLQITIIVAVAGGLLAMMLWRKPRDRPSMRSVCVLVGLSLCGAFALARIPARNFVPTELRMLATMGEPSLQDIAGRDREAAIYRMLWEPSFHHPVCVRIERDGDGAMLSVKMIDGYYYVTGAGRHEPGFLALDRTIRLGAGHSERLEQLVERTAFWESATWPQKNGNDAVIMDGDMFMVEGTKAGLHHRLRARNPIAPQVALSRYMLELTGIDFLGLFDEYHPTEEAENPG